MWFRSARVYCTEAETEVMCNDTFRSYRWMSGGVVLPQVTFCTASSWIATTALSVSSFGLTMFLDIHITLKFITAHDKLN